MKINRILIPVDGSDHSFNAARYGIDMAILSSAEILLLHCHRRFPVVLAEPHFQNAINAIMEESEQMLAPFVRMLEASGVTFETRILEGSAGKMIPEVARASKMDLIVMGSRGCSDLEGLIMGSVAHKVLYSSSCPVLIVK